MSPAADRRQLAAAALAAAAAGALALSAAGQRWAQVTAERRAPFPPVTGMLSGGDAAPLVPASGLVLLAAAVALLAVRGVGRVVVGLLVAAAGAALVLSGLRVLAGGVPDAAADLPGLGGGQLSATTVEVSATWPVLVVVAGLLAVVAGGLAAARGRAWPAMGQRYERAPAVRRSAEDRADDAWKALDRGEDPTDVPPGRPL
ncbi:Trp biosynthesis-associated membrane protein [Blastococcus capsensis]|uniref:Trp biosynthesis-associated membrane protein n=1 Tax=Blastococcus capsensis TaxID=1564163 RepID=UPI0025412CB8|nr:Trp biosynthesis-associated membrane protein [Blastococcus capsensis]MDK3256060.1 Trp biosynthesis-associated membrane protein [Blastococcus capsensis]